MYIKDASWWENEAPKNARWGWKMVCKIKINFKQAYNQNLWLDAIKNYTIKSGYQWLVGEQENVNWCH